MLGQEAPARQLFIDKARLCARQLRPIRALWSITAGEFGQLSSARSPSEDVLEEIGQREKHRYRTHEFDDSSLWNASTG